MADKKSSPPEDREGIEGWVDRLECVEACRQTRGHGVPRSVRVEVCGWWLRPVPARPCFLFEPGTACRAEGFAASKELASPVRPWHPTVSGEANPSPTLPKLGEGVSSKLNTAIRTQRT
ncbi:MAG: hypothetical protein AMXMBFR81_05270 [Chthonomonas sp.]